MKRYFVKVLVRAYENEEGGFEYCENTWTITAKNKIEAINKVLEHWNWTRPSEIILNKKLIKVEFEKIISVAIM